MWMRRFLYSLAPFAWVMALAQETAETQKKGVPVWVWIIVIVVVLIVAYVLYKRLTGRKKEG